MTGRLWRGWSALCLIAGTVVLPLFWEVFSGGSVLRFLALPLRIGWIVGVVRPVLDLRWVDPRLPAALVGVLVLGMTVAVGVDLAGVRFMHPGFFLALEWWQRALYPWIELLPPFEVRARPGYLWVAWAANAVEGALAVVWFLSRRPAEPPLPAASR